MHDSGWAATGVIAVGTMHRSKSLYRRQVFSIFWLIIDPKRAYRKINTRHSSSYNAKCSKQSMPGNEVIMVGALPQMQCFGVCMAKRMYTLYVCIYVYVCVRMCM